MTQWSDVRLLWSFVIRISYPFSSLTRLGIGPGVVAAGRVFARVGISLTHVAAVAAVLGAAALDGAAGFDLEAAVGVGIGGDAEIAGAGDCGAAFGLAVLVAAHSFGLRGCCSCHETGLLSRQ